MLKLKKIAITGGLASGKSTVCKFFKELGAYVVSADEISHELLNAETDLGQQIIRVFGSEILKNGQISRPLIAKKAFQDPKLLENLEQLLHPVILQKIEELYKSTQKEGAHSLFVVEVPLLFEIENESFYDVTVTVLADEEKAKERFTKAGFQESEYVNRMRRHLKPGQKAKKSNYIIHNNGSLQSLQSEVIQLNRIIQQQ